jgi:predicted glutamine amidotransferase
MYAGGVIVPFAFGVLTSDPNLLRCELVRLRPEVGLGSGQEPLGAAWYADDNVLLQRYAPRARPAHLDELGGLVESDALLMHGLDLPVGASLEENTQPFRYRQWLFACQGQVGGGEKLRALALEGLPEHLARVVKGSGWAELGFALFLAALRESGRADDPTIPGRAVAEALGVTARTLERLGGQAGGRGASVTLLCTNNRTLAAVRLGEEPLAYRLLEGAPTCDRCQLDGGAELETLRRAHTRRRSVAVATDVRGPGWIPLESGTGIGVGRGLDVEQVRF